MMKNKYGKLILILGLAVTLCVVAACQKKTLTYTWEEFQGLTVEQQMEFQNSFKSIEEFEAWMKSVNPQEETTAAEIELPWENGGKQP